MADSEKSQEIKKVISPVLDDDDDDIIESQPEMQPEIEISAKKLDVDNTEHQEKHQKTKEKTKKSGGHGFFIYFISLLFSKIYKAVRHSGTANSLTAYDSTAEAFRHSRIYSLFFSEKNVSRFDTLKVNFRKSVTEAKVPKLLSRLVSALLRVRSRIYGIALLLFGLTTLAIHYILNSQFNLFMVDAYAPITGICMCIVAMFFVLSNDTMAQAISESKLLSTLLYDTMGVGKPIFEEKETVELSSGGACVFGIFLGMLTLRFPAYAILLTMLILVYTALVIKSPESGMVSIILLAPFAPLRVIEIAIVLLTVSYIYKALCGKRTIKFEFPDLVVALFMLTVLSAEIISFGGIGNPFSSILYIFVYFIAVSILRSDIWFKRAISSLTLSVSIISVVAIVALSFSGNTSLEIFENINFEQYKELFSHILLYTLFILIAGFIKEQNKNLRFGRILILACAVIYLSLVLPAYALLAAIISFAVFLLLYNVKTIFPILGLGIFRIFITLFGYNSPIFINLETGKNSLISSNIMIRLLSNFGFTGIGSSDAADAIISSSVSVGGPTVIPKETSLILRLALELGYIGVILFALTFFFILQSSFSHGRLCPDKSDKYRITCYAGMCGLISAFICGIWENIWLSPRMSLIYWIIAGLTVACARCSVARTAGDERELLYLEQMI